MAKVSPKEGPRYRFKTKQFWACNGLIYVEDQATGEFNTRTVKDWVQVAKAFNDVVQMKWKFLYPDERDELYRCVSSMYSVWKDAKAMGDPTDGDTRKQVSKDRRPKSVLLSGEGDATLRHRPKNSTTFVLNPTPSDWATEKLGLTESGQQMSGPYILGKKSSPEFSKLSL